MIVPGGEASLLCGLPVTAEGAKISSKVLPSSRTATEASSCRCGDPSPTVEGVGMLGPAIFREQTQGISRDDVKDHGLLTRVSM